MNKYLFFKIARFIFGFILLTACSTTKSVLPIENGNDLESIVQRCGGQIWGYANRIKGQNYSSWSGTDYLDTLVLIISDLDDVADEINFQFLIQTPRNDVNLQFDPSQIQIYAENKIIKSNLNQFSFLVERSTIEQKYSDPKYIIEKNPAKENSWKVTEKIIGNLWMKDPIYIDLENDLRLQIKDNKIDYKFNKDRDRSAYAMISVKIPRKIYSPKTKFTFILPEFSFNEKNKIAKKEYIFNYDETLIKKSVEEWRSIRRNKFRTVDECLQPRLMMLKLKPEYNYNPFRLLFWPFEPRMIN